MNMVWWKVQEGEEGQKRTWLTDMPEWKGIGATGRSEERLLSHPSAPPPQWLTKATGMITDLPTFYEIKAEDLPPFGKKTRKIFCSENIEIFLSAGDTE